MSSFQSNGHLNFAEIDEEFSKLSMNGISEDHNLNVNKIDSNFDVSSAEIDEEFSKLSMTGISEDHNLNVNKIDSNFDKSSNTSNTNVEMMNGNSSTLVLPQRRSIILLLNGEKYVLTGIDVGMTLLQWLRSIGKSGTKLACGEGGCGACTVMVTKLQLNADGEKDRVTTSAVNACLMPLVAADSCSITTVEGIGQIEGGVGLHIIQQRMVEMHGSQCGYCTPGIVMAIYSNFAANKGNVKMEDMEEHMDGNLCRCTGYRPIWDAAKSLCSDAHNCSDELKSTCSDIEEIHTCTMHKKDMINNKNNEIKNDEKKDETLEVCSTRIKLQKNKPLNQIVSRKVMREMTSYPDKFKKFAKQSLQLKSKATRKSKKALMTYHRPRNVDELIIIKREHPGAKLVVGNTELGIDVKFRGTKFEHIVSTAAIQEFHKIHWHDINLISNRDIVDINGHSNGNGHFSTVSLTLGASVTLQNLQKFCTNRMKVLKEKGLRCEYAQAFHDMLRWFASVQIRNVASIGGNIVNASPISDMIPVFIACKAQVEYARPATNANGELGVYSMESVALEDFITGYRTVGLGPSDVLVYINFPNMLDCSDDLFFVEPFKQGRRREDDISIVTGCMLLQLEKINGNQFVIKEFRIALGGMAATPIRCCKTEKALEGRIWSDDTINEALNVMHEEIDLPKNVPGGQADYRMALALSFLKKFYISCSMKMKERSISTNKIYADVESAAKSFITAPKPTMMGVQSYVQDIRKNGKAAKGLETSKDELNMKQNNHPSGKTPLGKNLPHLSGGLHTSGEALYVDDIPEPDGIAYAELVLSTQAHAKILSVNFEEAMKIKGVLKVIDWRDIDTLKGDNALGPILHDEEAFAKEEVHHHGAVIACVIAETYKAAQAASRLVVVEYETLDSCITIQDGIKANSYFENTRHTLEVGNVRSIDKSELIEVSGDVEIGGQEHFYLECNSTLAVPHDGNTLLDVYSSTQAPSKTQQYCASASGLKSHQVVCKMKRMGGGFGGKETRAVFSAVAAAVGARILNRPVKITLERHVDMATTGQRHAFYAQYKAWATPTGDLVGTDIQLYSNGGSALDLSGPVLDRAILHSDGCYNWKHFRVNGVVVKTNQPPHTAFRGFGGPQGIMVCETIMDHLADKLKMSPLEIRSRNFYKEGKDTVPFGIAWKKGTFNVKDAWTQMLARANVQNRMAEVNEFNQKNRYVKRGISMLPTKFGINFTAKFMNQGGALVHVYNDGTIYISHGGTEMGQGLHTKVAQIAAHAFGVPLEYVAIGSTDTDKVANTMPTAASMSNDLYGMATLDACNQILNRLVPLRKKIAAEKKTKDTNRVPWKELIIRAYFDRIDLSAHGFYKVTDNRCGYDWDAPKMDKKVAKSQGYANVNSHRGHPFNYFTQGVAVTEVEVDCLTGDHRVLRSDVMVDLGQSLNPGIDIGQVEGAFIQGMGWCTTEEIIWGDDDHTWVRPRGRLQTSGPGTYKIPSFNDTPAIFNVSLMENVENKVCVHSSKAVGEPPFFLGASVLFAIRRALIGEDGQWFKKQDFFPLRSPMTTEKIRMAFNDEIAHHCKARTKPNIEESIYKEKYSM